MFKSTARHVHFASQEGSHSVRVTQRGYGGKSLQGDPVAILPTLKEQLDTINARLKVLPNLIRAAPDFEGAERLRKELGAKNSQFFELRKTVYQGCMLAKERLFVKVARGRLPEDLFFSLMAEATEYWEKEGFEKLIPGPNAQERRRASKKLQYRAWKDGK